MRGVFKPTALPQLPLCAQASVKQLATSRERDFFKWVILPLPIYRATVPAKIDADATSAFGGLGSREISMILPSDHLTALFHQGENVSSPI